MYLAYLISKLKRIFFVILIIYIAINSSTLNFNAFFCFTVTVFFMFFNFIISAIIYRAFIGYMCS